MVVNVSSYDFIDHYFIIQIQKETSNKNHTSYWINNMHQMCISGTEPYSVILSQTKYLKSWYLMPHKCENNSVYFQMNHYFEISIV